VTFTGRDALALASVLSAVAAGSLVIELTWAVPIELVAVLPPSELAAPAQHSAKPIAATALMTFGCMAFSFCSGVMGQSARLGHKRAGHACT
jgi:hypothetical protein